MQYLTPLNTLGALSLAWIVAIPARGEQAGKYTDVVTKIRFRGTIEPSGFTFGLMTPQKPTTDFVAQIVAPLVDGAGWGGVSLGNFMIGPLLIVTWAEGDKVMTAGRVADEYSLAGVVPYTANSITISPIPQGTFVNSTHICSTFLCAGCINSDSFDPSPAEGSSNPEVVFGYAYSQTPVDDPSDIDTRLSDHTGKDDGSGGFRVKLGDARSDDYDRYVEMAGGGKDGAEPERPHPSTPAPTPTPTPRPTPRPTPSPSPTMLPPVATSETGDGCWKDECVVPDGPDYSHRDMPLMELMVLLVVGLIYVVRAFMS